MPLLWPSHARQARSERCREAGTARATADQAAREVGRHDRGAEGGEEGEAVRIQPSPPATNQGGAGRLRGAQRSVGRRTGGRGDRGVKRVQLTYFAATTVIRQGLQFAGGLSPLARKSLDHLL